MPLILFIFAFLSLPISFLLIFFMLIIMSLDGYGSFNVVGGGMLTFFDFENNGWLD